MAEQLKAVSHSDMAQWLLDNLELECLGRMFVVPFGISDTIQTVFTLDAVRRIAIRAARTHGITRPEDVDEFVECVEYRYAWHARLPLGSYDRHVGEFLDQPRWLNEEQVFSLRVRKLYEFFSTHPPLSDPRWLGWCKRPTAPAAGEGKAG